jgi:hypothetical protein
MNLKKFFLKKINPTNLKKNKIKILVFGIPRAKNKNEKKAFGSSKI